ncbi:hypothetical protein HMPREF9701_04899 [Delftia acidovorans CCUG 274B]|uniref:HNH endonuclease n=1 Tax=Delftia lacustris TaxID=558537 RepID=A0A7T2YWJ6_9BURK|nr:MULTISPECIES: NUMOD4 domain-containing protein [Delftia]EPD35909.1 hypothetical protein HMPREF9702_05816 [Delftia acidovorans CCUG 15835]EPD36080.1 hypothetical protein HMPREF9701_04899 [Delftia acidovorans CCUG 274B]QPS83488.1 HNH endonuclease [Delftia lacustris]
MQEIWKPVPGHEGHYEVSNLGRVRSLSRHVRHSDGKSLRAVASQLKSLSRNSQGYCSVHLYLCGKMKKWYLHRLVAQVFVENVEGLPQVNHIDGDKENNASSNLEWCTGSGNCMHAVRNELYLTARGEQASNVKLKEEDVRDIRLQAGQGVMHKDLAQVFGVGRKAIGKIVNRQRWKHVI